MAKSRRGVIGKFPSLKMKRMIRFESLLELDCLYVLDFAAGITEFREQPLTIEYEYEDKTHGYTPDFYFVEYGRHYLVECKPQALLDDEDNPLKFQVGREWCSQNGMTYLVVTDQTLRAGYHLQNIKQLNYFARFVIHPHLEALIFSALVANGQVRLGDLAQIAPPDDATPYILHLAFYHKVSIPLTDTVINFDSPVSLPIEKAGLLPSIINYLDAGGKNDHT